MNRIYLRTAQRRARWGIFTLQTIVIAGLLYFAELSQARDDDVGGSRKLACATEKCRRTSPQHNTIAIPYQYRSQPPDVGFLYRRWGDEGGQVWVPGLTDNMNLNSKGIYNHLRSQNHPVAWQHLRNKVAEVVSLAQRYPSLRCQDNLNAARAGQVRMGCSYTDRGTLMTKNYDNMTTSQFDRHLDSQMQTIAEIQDERLRSGDTSPVPSAGSGNSGASVYSKASAGSSPYTRYINRHVAPNTRQVNRSTAAVFSSGNESSLTL